MDDGESFPQIEKTPYTILVVGGVGYGKSSFINSVLGEEKCKVGDTWEVGKTITEEVQEFTHKRKNNDYKFVDTPSIEALNASSEFYKLYMTRFDAIVIVCSIKSYQNRSSSMFKEVKKLFGEKLYPFSLVVFTFGDYLEESTVKEFIDNNSKLKGFIEKIENRYVVFDNTVNEKSSEAYKQRERLFYCLESVMRRNRNPNLFMERDSGCDLCICM